MKLRKFSFFDGETIDDNYILLGNEHNHIVNTGGLTLLQSLDFLWFNGRAINYFFRIDYDLNMIFKKEKLQGRTLHFFDAEEVYFKGYTIQYFKNKIFIIKKNKTVKRFFDISNFYKTSFIKTLEILNIKPTKEQSDILNKYKLLRSEFSLNDITNIIEYNKIECILGCEMVKKIYFLLPENLKTWSLYGASALTEKFLRQNEIHKINPYKMYNSITFEKAYYGGRMECLKIGSFKDIYKYDIRSAYPSIIKNLKEIIGFTHKPYKNQRIKSGNLYKIELHIFDKKLIGLLPVRLKSGYLIFPDHVKGFYYGVEVWEILKYEKLYSIDIQITEVIDIQYGNKIFSDYQIEELYLARKKLKAENNKTEYMIKILLNSIYGKFVQQVGKGKYLNFLYGGYITASTRSLLLSACIDNPYNIIFLATDGILTEKKLNVKIGNGLGEWEELKIKSAQVLQSGVYYIIDSTGKEINGSRGFRRDVKEIINEIKINGKAVIEQNIFIGNKYFEKNKFAFAGYRCCFKKIIREIVPENQIKRLFNINKFIVNKKYNSYILDGESLYQLNKIEKIDFSEDDNILELF